MKGITMVQWINLFRNNGFILQTPITFFVRKIGSVHIVELGLTVGGRRNTDEFGNFKKSLYIKRFDFCFI